MFSGSAINQTEYQNRKKDISEDLTLLFGELVSSQGGNNQNNTEEIDKSTLMSLLMYLDIHKSETEFFSYIKRNIENSTQLQGKTTLNKKEFLDLFMEPKINFQNLKNDEMASIFKIFDYQQKGSFSADDFLYYYKSSPEFNELNKKEQEEMVDKIKKDFEVISGDKEITPIEFFKIINMANQ